jgi:glycosyltransferase involved in cell wall biosynthesis
VISDDSSTDETVNVITSISDCRIKLYSFSFVETNTEFLFNRISKNFENALIKAKGDIIFFADQDDIWHPNKVVKVVESLSNFSLVLHDCIIINEINEIIHNSYFQKNRSKKGIVYNFVNSSYLGCCMAFKRELLIYTLPLPSVSVPHDIWFGLWAELKLEVCFLPERLLYYRRHSNNNSTSSGKSTFSTSKKIKYRILLLWAFCSRLITKYSK